MTNYINKFGSFLWRYKFTFLTLIYLIVVSLGVVDYPPSKPIVISALCLGFFLHIFSRTKYRIVFVIIFAFIVTVNAYFAFVLSSPMTMGFLGSMVDTNMSEAVSMSKDILPYGIPIYILTFGLIYLSVRELGKSKLKIKYSLIGLAVYVLIILPFFCFNFLRLRPTKLWHDFPEHPFVTIDELGLWNAPILYGNITTIIHLIAEKIEFKEFVNTDLKALPEGIIQKEKADIPQKIFFVIGESSSNLHYSLYGYERPTTPRLDSICRMDSTLKYYNGLASAALTRDALRLSLTNAIPSDMKRFFTFKTVIDMANDAGYETIWIAQRAQLGAENSDAYINAINSASKKTEVNDSYIDTDLISIVQEMNEVGKKQFILVHLCGSHAEYVSRYDKEDARALPENYAEVDYDRTLHQTDRTLAAIYDIMKQDSSAVMLYYSDHGEIVNKGHGFKKGKVQFQVPLITVNHSQTPIDSIINRYSFNLDDKDWIGCLSTYHAWAEILGFSVSDEVVRESIEDSQTIYHSDGQVDKYINIKE